MTKEQLKTYLEQRLAEVFNQIQFEVNCHDFNGTLRFGVDGDWVYIVIKELKKY